MIYQMGRKPKAVYEMGLLTDAEIRIIKMHTLWKEGTKPWEYDLDRYPDNEMFGRFYEDDWANLRWIDSMIADREGIAEARARGQT